jgi:DNA primase
MNAKSDLSPIKQIPIIEVAKRLGIQVRGTKAMCFMGHDKASPSLSFHKKWNSWKCFGACGKGGDNIALVREKEGLDFKGALDWFARNFAVDVSRPYRGQSRRSRLARAKKPVVVQTEIPEQQEFAADPELYEWLIGKCASVSNPTGVNYLDTHAISQECATRFNIRELRDPVRAFRKLLEKWGEQRVYRSGVAWGSDGRPLRLVWSSYALLFPFYAEGVVTYIQARMFQGDRKFLNPRGIALPMFNVDKLRELKPGRLVHLCEGVPDAVALESQGLTAVGILGANSFRAEWVDRFLKFKVVVLGDGDPAGAKFATAISTFFMERGKAVQCKTLPKGKDVADVLTQARRSK